MGGWGERHQLELYNLTSDIEEKQDLSKRHPEIIARIKKIIKESHDDPRS
jgi:hypothetical protein